MKYKKISRCRLCYSRKIKPIIDFGRISISSAFPYKNSKYKEVTPMVFGICKNCRLSQLLHNYDLKGLYNKNYGCRSGSNIPIISEQDSRNKNPDFYLVCPWHFKKEFIKRERKFLLKGDKLIFPLPEINIISKKNL